MLAREDHAVSKAVDLKQAVMECKAYVKSVAWKSATGITGGAFAVLEVSICMGRNYQDWGISVFEPLVVSSCASVSNSQHAGAECFNILRGLKVQGHKHLTLGRGGVLYHY